MDFFRTPRMRARTLNLFYQVTYDELYFYQLFSGLCCQVFTMDLQWMQPVWLAIHFWTWEFPALLKSLLSCLLVYCSWKLVVDGKSAKIWITKSWRGNKSQKLLFRSMIFFNFMGGFACMLMMFVESGSTASIILPLCGKFALTGGYGGIYVYTAELFPTTLR